MKNKCNQFGKACNISNSVVFSHLSREKKNKNKNATTTSKFTCHPFPKITGVLKNARKGHPQKQNKIGSSKKRKTKQMNQKKTQRLILITFSCHLNENLFQSGLIKSITLDVYFLFYFFQAFKHFCQSVFIWR